MSLEWKSCKIGDLGKIFSGGTPSTKIKEYWDGDLNWLSSGETRNTYIYTTDKFITEEGANNSSTKLANKGDIVIASAGQGFTRGQSSMVMIDTYVNQSVIVISPNDKVNNHYLLYNLKFRYPELRQLSDHASTRGSLTTKIIKGLDINLPDLNTQNKIATIIQYFDKKIETNKRINKNLEELMHVLFKKYFIDNNPFYVENDENWNIIKLKDLIIRNRDKINDFDNWKDELLIDLSNMPRFSIAISNFDKGKKFTSNIYKLNKYDLLFGSIRPYFGKVGFSPINGVVTGTVHSFKPIDDIYYSLVLSLISSKTFINYTVSVSKGTKMPSVKWDDFINYEFAIPDDLSKIGEYNKILLPLIHKIEKNILEIQRLTKLRDTLLPKLMSGEIDVSEVNCDLKIIIRKIYIKSSKLFLWRYLSENKNHIKNTKSNETLLKSRTIHKINKFLAKFNARYRHYRQ